MGDEPYASGDTREFVAEFYDRVVRYRERRDVRFYVEMARQCGGPILELACGTGRVLIPTAREGIEIVGLDFSPYMLALCRDKLSREPEEVRSRVTLVEGDIRRFDLGRTFRLVTMPFRPFQHLVTVEEQLACLGCVRRHLDGGGRLVLDLFNPDLRRLVDERYPLEDALGEPFVMPDGRRVEPRARVTSRDLFQQLQDLELVYEVTHPDGRHETLVHGFPYRYLFRFEVEHLLARCGFDLEDVFADYDRSPYGSRYPGELIVVARRR